MMGDCDYLDDNTGECGLHHIRCVDVPHSKCARIPRRKEGELEE